MATDVERLVLRLEANMTQLEKQLGRGRAVVKKNLKQMEDDASKFSLKMNKQMQSIGVSSSALMSALKPIGGAIAAAFSVDRLLKYAETWAGIKSLLVGAGIEAQDTGRYMDKIAKMAMATNAPLRETAELYAGLTRSTKAMGANQAQILRVTEIINKSGAIGGASDAAKSGAMIQLLQAFDMGALKGQELNSILVGMPVLAQALAKEFGVSVGELKKLGSEGKLVSDRVMTAILKSGKDIDVQFAKLAPTLGQSFVNLQTALTSYFGSLDQSTSATATLAQGVQYLANNMDSVVRIAAVLGLALVSPLSAATAAVLLFGDNITPIAGEIATLGDYTRAALSIASEGFFALSEEASASFQSVLTSLTDVVSGANISADDITNAFKGVGNFIIATFVAAYGTIVTTFTALPAAIADTVISAMNNMVATIEESLNRVVFAVNSVIEGMNSLGGYIGATMNKIGDVNLGRLENRFAGAGEKAGKAFGENFNAYSKDYIGTVFNGLKGEANKFASSRIMQDAIKAATGFQYDGALDQKLTPSKGRAGKSGGKGGGAAKQNDWQKEISKINEKIAANEREAQSVGLSAQEALKAKTAHELLNAAKQSGIPITEDMKAKVDQLSESYAASKAKLDDAKTAQEGWKELQTEIGNSLIGYLSDVASGGENAQKALMNLTKKLAEMALQAAILGSGPLAKIFGMGSGGGLMGALFGGLGARASGGPVQAGHLYQVNENGKEYFRPNQNGTIVPAGLTPKQSPVSANITNAPTYHITPADGVTPAQLQAVMEANNRKFTRQLPNLMRSSSMRFA